MIRKVIIIGPAHPLRGGGITTFNHRLCQEFLTEGYDCRIFSFSLQYPKLLFPGTSQYTTEPAPKGIRIYSVINSIHPLNWWHFGTLISKIRPDLVVVRFWIPFMGPSLGTILRRIRRNRYTRIIAIADNVVPHEKRPGDKLFTRYFLKACDGFITMGEQVTKDLKEFGVTQPVRRLLHPLYDNFGEKADREEARNHLQLPTERPILLFFGFIRKYKGLDILLEALKLLIERCQKEKKPLPLLLVAGEFYDDEKVYQAKIDHLGIRDFVVLRTTFIPESEVRYYFGAADGVVQPYRQATQSGVVPLAYHFEKPMVVTRVGSLPDQVPDGKAGLVCEPEANSLANALSRYLELGEDHFLPQLRDEKMKYSWPAFVRGVADLAESIPIK